jgi:hypothetical protein
MWRLGIAACLCLGLTNYAIGAVFGGSNLGFGGYPDPECVKPYKPPQPYGSSETEVEIYNSQVRTYNSELEVYISCIREYLDNADDDIERIQEKAQDAIDKAKAP